MWFQTMELADGSLKIVVSPAAMLKLCQLRKAFCESGDGQLRAAAVAVAEPEGTVMPVGLANALPATSSMKTAATNRAEHGMAI